MVIGFGNSTVLRLRTILEDLSLTLNMAKSGALVNSSSSIQTSSDDLKQEGCYDDMMIL
jgi:hypothetical protein